MIKKIIDSRNQLNEVQGILLTRLETVHVLAFIKIIMLSIYELKLCGKKKKEYIRFESLYSRHL